MMTNIYAHVISFDWSSAVLAYELGGPGFVEAEITNTGVIVKSSEATGTGRLYLEGT